MGGYTIRFANDESFRKFGIYYTQYESFRNQYNRLYGSSSAPEQLTNAESNENTGITRYAETPVRPLSSSVRKIVENIDLGIPRGKLTSPQRTVEIGAPIPIPFGHRRNGAGGIFMSPPATEMRITNDAEGNVQVWYRLALSQGRIGDLIEDNQVWHGQDQRGTVTGRAFGEYPGDKADAGGWAPGNTLERRFQRTFETYTLSLEGIVNKLAGENLVNPIAQLYEVNLESRGEYVTEFKVRLLRPQFTAELGSIGDQEPTGTDATAGDYWNGLYFKEPIFIPDEYREWYYSQTNFLGVANSLQVYKVTDFLLDETEGVSLTPEQVEYGAVNTLIYEAKRDPSVEPYRVNVDLTGVLGSFLTTESVSYQIQVEETNHVPIEMPTAPIYVGSGTGSYEGISTVSVTDVSAPGDELWANQFHIFIDQGIFVERYLDGLTEHSDNIADLARHVLTTYGDVPDALLDHDSLELTARFTDSMHMLFNGLIEAPQSAAALLERIAPFFLLTPSTRGGRQGLRPVLPATESGLDTSAVTPTWEWRAEDIIPGSVRRDYYSRTERAPFSAMVQWRLQGDGVAGEVVSAEVAVAGELGNVPVVSYDISEFGCHEEHARAFGAYMVARSRLVTHRVELLRKPGDWQWSAANGDVVQLVLPRRSSAGDDGEWASLYRLVSMKSAPGDAVSVRLEHLPVDGTGASAIVAAMTALLS